jgi:hypothetical protein
MEGAGVSAETRLVCGTSPSHASELTALASTATVDAKTSATKHSREGILLWHVASTIAITVHNLITRGAVASATMEEDVA